MADRRSDGQLPLQASLAAAGLPATQYASHCMQIDAQQLAEMQWRVELAVRLEATISAIAAKWGDKQSICICQTWLGADGGEGGPLTPHGLEVTLWADPKLAVVMDPLFQDLRNKSCQGPVFFRNSMPGKVWRSGAVQIVQNLKILPPTLHPRSQLSEEALERLAEALYIPIYDVTRPAKGQVCVLEVLLSSRATETLVADVISFIGSVLTALQLSLANPIQQPVHRSVLCGRRARAPDSDGGSDSDAEKERRPSQQPRRGGQPADGMGQSARPCGTAASSGVGAGTSMGQSQQQQQQAHVGERVGATAGRPTVPPSGEGGCSPADGCRDEAAAAAAVPGGVVAPNVDTGAVGPHEAPGTAACAELRVCTGPTVSEQPTLPASPTRATAAAATAAASGGPPTAAAVDEGFDTKRPGPLPGPVRQDEDGQAAHCGPPGVSAVGPRRLPEGFMQRSKSVASVAALSDGADADDEEEDDNRDRDVQQ